ncbi:XdhC family protein [Streptoalloteichus hindustanus]|uniref:Xanthine dehydrogenase accessory factor n=1 Tax=Streptoalloteichus hindustanus TaxID=2017 RepID=A0A1M5Q173_STRHI|nr:XdhC/CoxI family protein [Streptoalloteichus hindustanus]SHH07788.1 xanthine dehydrogenase accessory factor [Streptoalloteichus hindustanus]
MRDIATQVLDWDAAGQSYAVASVVAVRGSAPREVGAAVAVRADGAVAGSVSGGCVEAAVHELAERALEQGRPIVETFGVADAENPFAPGLTCGGELEVFVQPMRRPASGPVVEALRVVVAAERVGAEAGEPVALARVVRGPERAVGAAIAVYRDRHTGSTGDDALDRVVVAEARAMSEQGGTGLRAVCLDGVAETTIFVESWVTAPRMLVFGAIDYAAALAAVGRFLGYRVTVCDARPIFATSARFPHAHEVVVEWPHRYLARTATDERTVVCVLTHDPKFDVPVLVEALRRPLAYVGALGSRRTHEDRTRRLRAAGMTDAELGRLRSPIGLDLGARTPEETAVSIVAEIVAARRGGGGAPLSTVDGSIHHEPARVFPA